MTTRRAGRALDELRPVEVVPGFHRLSEGSALYRAGGTVVLATASVDDAHEALERAVEAAARLDAHTALLLSRPRARLAVDIDAVKLRITTGDDEAVDELSRLEAERDELAEASVAHDLAAKQALEACADITTALATRTAWQKAHE